MNDLLSVRAGNDYYAPVKNNQVHRELGSWLGPYTVTAIAVFTPETDWKRGELERWAREFFSCTVKEQEAVIETLHYFERADWLAVLDREAELRKQHAIEVLQKRETIVKRVLCDLSKRAAR
jgi:hypothetical protein